jgi:hypothetical protein
MAAQVPEIIDSGICQFKTYLERGTPFLKIFSSIYPITFTDIMQTNTYQTLLLQYSCTEQTLSKGLSPTKQKLLSNIFKIKFNVGPS